MPQYEYTVVPFIGKIKSGLRSTQTVGDVANQLSAVIQAHAAAGWMFHSINSVNIDVSPGCIASLFGRTAFSMLFDQIVFYREAGSPASSGQSTPVTANAMPTPEPPSPTVPTPPPIPR